MPRLRRLFDAALALHSPHAAGGGDVAAAVRLWVRYVCAERAHGGSAAAAAALQWRAEKALAALGSDGGGGGGGGGGAVGSFLHALTVAQAQGNTGFELVA